MRIKVHTSGGLADLAGRHLLPSDMIRDLLKDKVLNHFAGAKLWNGKIELNWLMLFNGKKYLNLASLSLLFRVRRTKERGLTQDMNQRNQRGQRCPNRYEKLSPPRRKHILARPRLQYLSCIKFGYCSLHSKNIFKPHNHHFFKNTRGLVPR